MFKRFTRLSLRALLLFVTVMAIVVALWHRSSQRQKMLVEGIREYEGNVAYDWQIDFSKHDFIPNATPPYPSWLVDCFGEDYFYSVHFAQVNLSQDPQKPILQYGESLDELNVIRGDPSGVFKTAYLPKLRRLEIWVDTPLDLSCVANLSALEHLSVQSSEISGLSALKGLRNLRYLNLTTDALESPELLGDLTQLTTLGISPFQSDAEIDPDMMESIYAKLPNLKLPNALLNRKK